MDPHGSEEFCTEGPGVREAKEETSQPYPWKHDPHPGLVTQRETKCSGRGLRWAVLHVGTGSDYSTGSGQYTAPGQVLEGNL